jgi:hypothetical protein
MVLRFNLIQAVIDGEPVYMNGLEVDDKTDTKRVGHSASHDALDYVKGERTIDFTFTDPKDQPLLFDIYNRCIDSNFRFTLILFGKNLETGAYVPVLSLGNCTLNNAKSSIKAKEEWKPTATGFALSMERLETQYLQDQLNIGDFNNTLHSQKKEG